MRLVNGIARGPVLVLLVPLGRVVVAPPEGLLALVAGGRAELVVDVHERVARDARIGFDVSGETVARTVPGMWEKGRKLNFEPALRLGDELGGHLVTGHVDTVGEVVTKQEKGGSWHLAIRIPREFAPFVAEKGSITVDGVSLTVNEVHDREDGTCDFALNIIPHTAEVTTLGTLEEGAKVNLEIDVLARYLKRMQGLAG